VQVFSNRKAQNKSISGNSTYQSYLS